LSFKNAKFAATALLDVTLITSVVSSDDADYTLSLSALFSMIDESLGCHF